MSFAFALAFVLTFAVAVAACERGRGQAEGGVSLSLTSCEGTGEVCSSMMVMVKGRPLISRSTTRMLDMIQDLNISA